MDEWSRLSRRFDFDFSLKSLIRYCGHYSPTDADHGPRVSAFQPVLDSLYRGISIVVCRDKRSRPELDSTWRSFAARPAKLWMVVFVFDQACV